MHTRISWLLILSFSTLASPILADNYLVQIGAFRHPSADYADAAQKVGPVANSISASGITRVRVGPFASMNDANRAKSALQTAGYSDAFVLRAGGGVSETRSIGSSRTSLPPVAAKHSRGRDESILSSLSDEVRDRVVVLDGVYHVQDGGEFIPLRDYQRDVQRY